MRRSMTESLQDRYAPNLRCFGCGPANELGLRIKSRVEGDTVVADFVPSEHHQAFDGMVNGGILGALLDCHSNWTAAYALMKERGLDTPPCTVTAEFHVKLVAVTPLGPGLHLVARPVRVSENSVTVEAEVFAQGRITATCTGVFVAVKPDHPAYHRW
jgi:acyl-coenzyme A thioesterase PaaI-like protein